MEDPIQKAQQDIPDLQRFLRSLLSLAKDPRLIRNVSSSEHDHFAFMALPFLFKQIDHAESILALNDKRDAILIARSMIEGLCQLLLAAKDEGLALRWRAFCSVHDWRMMNLQIDEGESVDEKQREKIEARLDQYGDQFLRPKAKKKRDEGKPLPKDPYYPNWIEHDTRNICRCVGLEDLYVKVYKYCSAWVHWGPEGIGDAIDRQQGQIHYFSKSLEATATALATGFQCLMQTLDVVNEHLERGMASEIAELRDRYFSRFSFSTR